jgi:hypothetical protein
MRVVIEGEQSNKAIVESGVPQGTVLGLLLFICHINDLPECVKSQVRLFADDCLLYRQIKNREDHISKTFEDQAQASDQFLATTKSEMYFKIFLATNNKYISVIAHSTH